LFTNRAKVNSIVSKAVENRSELPLETVKKKYGNHYNVILGDLKQSDDLRVLDYNGYNVFYNFKFSEMGKAVYHEAP